MAFSSAVILENNESWRYLRSTQTAASCCQPYLEPRAHGALVLETADVTLLLIRTIMAQPTLVFSWRSSNPNLPETTGGNSSLWHSHPSGPHPSGPHPSGPHPSGPHPSGRFGQSRPIKVGQSRFGQSRSNFSGQSQFGQSRNWPKSANKDGQSPIGQSRSQPVLQCRCQTHLTQCRPLGPILWEEYCC